MKKSDHRLPENPFSFFLYIGGSVVLNGRLNADLKSNSVTWARAVLRCIHAPAAISRRNGWARVVVSLLFLACGAKFSFAQEFEPREFEARAERHASTGEAQIRAERHARAGHGHRHHHTNTTTAITTNTTPTTTTTTPTAPTTTTTTTTTGTNATTPKPPPPAGGDPQWNGTTNSSWNTNTNWSPATVPGAADTATFNNAGNSNTTISLAGSAVSVLNIVFDTSSAAAYTIGSGGVGNQTFTLSNAGAITVNSTVTNNQLFNANLTMGSNGTSATSFTFTNNSTTATLTIAGDVSEKTANNSNPARTLNLAGSGNGVISGAINGNGATNGSNAQPLVSLVKSGAGTWTLSGANTYAGTTTISAGTLKSAAANALGGTSGITVNGTGTLLLSANNTINDSATMTLNGNTSNNTLVLSGASEGTSSTTTATAGLGALTLLSQSRLDFLQSTSTIVFGKTGATAFVDASNFKLDIYNYIGDSTPAGNSEHLVFQQNMTGLTGDFEFWNGSSFVAATATQLGSSAFWEITPVSLVPEPSTWVAGSLAFATLLYTQRRRLFRTIKRVT